MACSDAVFLAAKEITKNRKKKEFTIKEIREYLESKKSVYSENTIRGQIVGNCNVDYPKHRLPYFKKVKDKSATYKLIAKQLKAR